MKNNTYTMPYEAMRYHIGHNIQLNDVWDWQTNRETSLEVRCNDCENCEPIMEVDTV